MNDAVLKSVIEMLQEINADEVVRVTFDTGSSPNGYEGMTINVIFSEPKPEEKLEEEEWMA